MLARLQDRLHQIGQRAGEILFTHQHSTIPGVNHIHRLTRSRPVWRRGGQDLLNQVLPAASIGQPGGVKRPAAHPALPPDLSDHNPHPASLPASTCWAIRAAARSRPRRGRPTAMHAGDQLRNTRHMPPSPPLREKERLENTLHRRSVRPDSCWRSRGSRARTGCSAPGLQERSRACRRAALCRRGLRRDGA